MPLNDEFTVQDYRVKLQEKLADGYKILSILENSSLVLSTSDKELIRDFIAKYVKSLSYKLQKSYEDKKPVFINEVKYD